MMKRTIWLTALTGLLLAGPALAQEELPVELMLMIDTSTSMGHSMTVPGQGPLRHCVDDYRSRRREFRGSEEEIITWLPEEPEYEPDWTRLQSIKRVLAGRPIRNVDLILDDPNKTACFVTKQPLDEEVARDVYADLVGLGPGISDEADIFGNGGLKISKVEGRRTTRLIGGGGGERYLDPCPLGEVLIGLSGEIRIRTGYLGRLRGICGRVSFDGQNAHTVQATELPNRGLRGGGGAVSSICPDGQAVVGFSGRTGDLVDQISLRCAPILLAGARLNTGPAEERPPIGGNGGNPQGAVSCPGGKLASGVIVRAGDAIDAFGVQCGTHLIELNVGAGSDTDYERSVLGQCYDYNDARPEDCQPMRLVLESTPPDRFHSDGLIHQYAKSVKFGLMTTDDNPGSGFDWPSFRRGATSFGADHEDASLDTAAFLRNALLAEKLTEGDRAPRLPNLGVRGPGAGLPGDLVSGHMGVIENGARSAFRPVGDQPAQVERHNDYLMRSIRGLVPFGFSPLSAMLYDLHYYYRTQDPRAGPNDVPDRYGLIPDLKYGCRRHVAVLLTDGVQSNYYASPECLRNGAGCPLHSGFPYSRLNQYVERLERDVPSFGFHVILMNGSDEAVAQLSAAVGNREGAFFHVRNHNELRSALDQIIRKYIVKAGAQTKPLIVSPGDGDEVDDKVRQFRITSFGERHENVPYGRVLGEALGCRGGENNDPNGKLQFIGSEFVRYHEALTRQLKRTAVASHGDRENSFQALGNGPAIFSDDGEFRAREGMSEENFRALTEAAAAAGIDPLSYVFQVLAGFFGPAATPADNGDCSPVCGIFGDKVRQLGETFDGDLIAIPPPNLGLLSESYQRFRTENRDRPTLVATGARDGAVHFFRLADGREVFSFIPRIAWPSMRRGLEQPGGGTLQVDGPLMARDMAVCRSLGDGREGCPADAQATEFRTFVVGGVGDSGSNLFGIDITDAKALMDPESQNLPIDADTFKSWDLITRGDGLGGR